MEYKRIIVMLPEETLDSAEARLRQLHVAGITVSRVRGYGEYKNHFASDWKTERAKIEIFVEAAKVDAVIDALGDLSRGAPPGAGIAAVVPVERFVHLRSVAESREPSPRTPDVRAESTWRIRP